MTNFMLTPDHAIEIGQTISALRARFVTHDQYIELAEQFDLLLYRRRADLAAGRHPEARGIVLVGGPGSGKSTAIQRLFLKHPDIQILRDDKVEADVVSFPVPSPATLKSVGLSCLKGLGYPLRRDRTASIIWDLVQAHLRQRKVLFMHLDEMQDLHVNRSQSETQSVVNTLKSLMQNSSWPVGLVLSGTRALKDLVNLDPQLSRRLIPIEFVEINSTANNASVATVISQYADTARLSLNPTVLDAEHLRRLIHAAANELGLVIEMVIAAIEEALLRQEVCLTIDAFRRAYRRKAGCPDVLNPIVADDWRAINTRQLFGGGDEHPQPSIKRRAQL